MLCFSLKLQHNLNSTENFWTTIKYGAFCPTSSTPNFTKVVYEFLIWQLRNVSPSHAFDWSNLVRFTPMAHFTHCSPNALKMEVLFGVDLQPHGWQLVFSVCQVWRFNCASTCDGRWGGMSYRRWLFQVRAFASGWWRTFCSLQKVLEAWYNTGAWLLQDVTEIIARGHEWRFRREWRRWCLCARV